MDKIKSPIIYETKYNLNHARQLSEKIENHVPLENQKFLLNYPTVYVINNQLAKSRQSGYTVYVGETNDIQRRTLEHLEVDPEHREDWARLEEEKNAQMYVIGHEHFNKSLTLDIENRLMKYLASVEAVTYLNNRRENAQNDYYPANEMEPIFNKIWRKLHKVNPDLFPAQRLLENSALFKASPFNKLTLEQLNARGEILQAVDEALQTGKVRQLVKVTGEAGAGKTVLMSNIFYELSQNPKIEKVAMMVNHVQQEKVYQQIVEKLGMGKTAEVIKAPTFIKNNSPEHPIDVAFVDEAHLLLTQRSQSYNGYGTNELIDIINRAKVTLVVYDEHQVLQATQIVEDDDRVKLKEFDTTEIPLHNQMRIDANTKTIQWLRNMIDQGIIGAVPFDDKYDLQLFDSPKDMEIAIRQKNEKDGGNGLSRMVATFDWSYSSTPKKNGEGYWEVSEGDWHMPWNLQLKSPAKGHRNVQYKNLAWPEQPHTINEIGSTYTVQGLDLNYVGVEIGPSVKYRDGKIVFDPTASKNKKAVQKRTMHDGKKVSHGAQLLKNELNVLLTRGVHGLYLHAVDPALQAALKKAFKAKK